MPWAFFILQNAAACVSAGNGTYAKQDESARIRFEWTKAIETKK